MTLENFLLDLLEDPVDHQNVLYNPRRRVAYEVRDSIPVLLPDESRTVSDAEHEQFTKDPSARQTGTKP